MTAPERKILTTAIRLNHQRGRLQQGSTIGIAAVGAAPHSGVRTDVGTVASMTENQAKDSFPDDQGGALHGSEYPTMPIAAFGSGAAVSPTEPLLVSIGDIGVTQSWVITPSGTRPVGQVQWMFTDMSRTTTAIPVWAIVCAIVFIFLCFLSLLLLLVKETRTEGAIQVIVQGPKLVHTTQLPVSSPQQVADYNARVNYARSISASAGMA